LGQLRSRGAPVVVVGRTLEKPEERANAPYRAEPRLERATFAPVAVVQTTREAMASARAVGIGVDRARAVVTPRGERRTALLEGVPSLEHAVAVPAGAMNLFGLEGDAPEQRPITTEATRATQHLELAFHPALHARSEAPRAALVLKIRDTSANLDAMVTAGERRALEPPRGVLQRVKADGLLVGRRLAPSEPVSPFVHHFWAVEWDLATPFTADTLPHPAACITVERGHRHEVAGVRTGRTQAIRKGAGRVFGITFRPAAFQRLLRAPMSSLTDRAVPIATVFGREGEVWARALIEAPEFEESVSIAETFLAARLPPLGRNAATTRDITERMMRDPSLLRASDVAAALDLDIRSLQRRFRHYVGVGPKWVIRRYRLHEAAEQLRAKSPPSLAALAASLGYADQAHFARDFKSVVGQSPGAFERLSATMVRST
jgi:AraC-like DNA-binding protein